MKTTLRIEVQESFPSVTGLLVSLREAFGLNQKQVGRLLDKRQGTMSKFENRRDEDQRVTEIAEYAGLFGLDVEVRFTPKRR